MSRSAMTAWMSAFKGRVSLRIIESAPLVELDFGPIGRGQARFRKSYADTLHGEGGLGGTAGLGDHPGLLACEGTEFY
jgi:hypothetical protein